MSPKEVEILNPLPGGLRRTSYGRALSFVRRGLAEFVGGRLRFVLQAQQRRTEEQEFLANRGGILYWNGARSRYVDGRDTAMYPPGCNVQFKRPDWVRVGGRRQDAQDQVT